MVVRFIVVAVVVELLDDGFVGWLLVFVSCFRVCVCVSESVGSHFRCLSVL